MFGVPATVIGEAALVVAIVTVCCGPLVMMGGEICTAPAPPGWAWVTTNCCCTPVLTLVSGCTRMTPAMMKTSPFARLPVPAATVMAFTGLGLAGRTAARVLVV